MNELSALFCKAPTLIGAYNNEHTATFHYAQTQHLFNVLHIFDREPQDESENDYGIYSDVVRCKAEGSL